MGTSHNKDLILETCNLQIEISLLLYLLSSLFPIIVTTDVQSKSVFNTLTKLSDLSNLFACFYKLELETAKQLSLLLWKPQTSKGHSAWTPFQENSSVPWAPQRLPALVAVLCDLR